MQQDYLKDILEELAKRNGGLVLEQDSSPKAVLLSLEKYNAMVAGATEDVQKNQVQVRGLFPAVGTQQPVSSTPNQANTNYISGDHSKKVVVLGLGFVGQANAIALIRMGYEVWAQDIRFVHNLYNDDDFHKIHIFADARNLPFSPDAKVPVMVCVNAYNTPEGQDLLPARTALAEARKITNGVVILRSTIVSKHFKKLDFDLYMPEFLHERTALQEAQFPEMLVLGYNNDKAKQELPKFIQDLTAYVKSDASRKFFEGSAEEASYIKYLHNIWNALRIGFVNEFGRAVINDGLPDSHEKVIDFIMDKAYYLRYGKPFGGHCLKKDTEGFYFEHRDMKVLQNLIESNVDHERFTMANDAPELYYGDK